MGRLEGQIDQFLEHCEHAVRLSPKTVRAYRCDLSQFVQWLAEDGRSEDVSREDLRAYVRHLNGLYAPSTAKRKVAALHAFYSWRLEEDLGDDPFYGLRIRIHEPLRLPRTIPQQDLSLIFAEAGNDQFDQPFSAFLAARERALIELLLETGLRISELCSLNLRDLDPVTNTILVMGKGSRERIAHIENPKTWDSLNAYLDCRAQLPKRRLPPNDKNALFVSRSGKRLSEQAAREQIQKLAERSGAQTHVTPHMFRHTFATMLLEDDVDIRYIQALLGHRSIKTTERYAYAATPKLRRIMREHSPRSAIAC